MTASQSSIERPDSLPSAKQLGLINRQRLGSQTERFSFVNVEVGVEVENGEEGMF